MLTPWEKLVLNSIVFGILATLFYVMFFGLQPFLIRSICRIIWYITGTLDGVEEVCT